MDVFDAIRTRRSIRKYLDKDVPFDSIIPILQAGKYAPSAGNLQNWKFIVVKNEGKKKAIADACLKQEWMEMASVHIIVLAEPGKAERYYGQRGARLYTIQGCAAAMENMLLTAHSLGLGACWVGAFDEDEIWRILMLPEEVSVQGIITVGYPDEQPQEPAKHRIEHIMFFEKWWGRIEFPKTYLGWWSAWNMDMVDKSKIVARRLKKKVKGIVDKRKRKKK